MQEDVLPALHGDTLRCGHCDTAQIYLAEAIEFYRARRPQRRKTGILSCQIPSRGERDPLQSRNAGRLTHQVTSRIERDFRALGAPDTLETHTFQPQSFPVRL